MHPDRLEVLTRTNYEELSTQELQATRLVFELNALQRQGSLNKYFGNKRKQTGWLYGAEVDRTTEAKGYVPS